MMAIADRIGIAAMNTELAELINEYKFSSDTQPTTITLLDAIKGQAEQQHHKFIEQQFSQISLYDLRLSDVKMSQTEQQTYAITLSINAAQYSANGQGEETEEAFSDLVDIVMFSNDPDDFSADNRILYRKKHLLKQGENSLTIEVDTLPKYVGVDPFVRYIDRESRDNVMAIP
jgi:ABC-2 type transport system permease protein